MFQHKTVLLKETVDGLHIKPDGIYVDCTLGGGGHSAYLLQQLTGGHLYAFDQDETAIQHAKEKFAHDQNRITFIKSNFRYLKSELNARGVQAVDGILYDLGVSSSLIHRNGDSAISMMHRSICGWTSMRRLPLMKSSMNGRMKNWSGSFSGTGKKNFQNKLPQNRGVPCQKTDRNNR